MPAATDLPAAFAPGTILAGKFRVERVLGAGGMGVVLQVHHLGLDQRVALKLLHPDALAEEGGRARFQREAQLAAQLTSPHVARVLDTGTLDDGAPYLVMEFLEGRDLLALLTDRGALPVAEVLSLLLQVCDAVGEAHARGIVHRDLKPQNLFLTQGRDGRPLVKVVDFGLAKRVTPAADHNAGFQTQTGLVMGSPAYMAPEQLQSSRRADARSDVWALGGVLYHCLAGATPFAASTLPALYTKVLTEAPPSLQALRPDVPAALVAITARCLAKEPGVRYPHARALGNALAAVQTALLAESARLRAATPETDVALAAPAAPRIMRPAPVAPPGGNRSPPGAARPAPHPDPGPGPVPVPPWRSYATALAIGTIVACALVLAVRFGRGNAADPDPVTPLNHVAHPLDAADAAVMVPTAALVPAPGETAEARALARWRDATPPGTAVRLAASDVRVVTTTWGERARRDAYDLRVTLAGLPAGAVVTLRAASFAVALRPLRVSADVVAFARVPHDVAAPVLHLEHGDATVTLQLPPPGK